MERKGQIELRLMSTLSLIGVVGVDITENSLICPFLAGLPAQAGQLLIDNNHKAIGKEVFMIEIRDHEKLNFHLGEVLAKNRRFENAAQTTARMILEKRPVEMIRGGTIMYDYPLFREGNLHIVGWYEEINTFVNFVIDASEGGDSKERAFVLVGEPGNGKTFFIKYVCEKFRSFISRLENRKYTFEFVGMEKLGTYKNLDVIQSQTLEDPMILAMNLLETQDESLKYLAQTGFTDHMLDRLLTNYRPLGASSEYIWHDIRTYCDGKREKMLDFIRIVPVRVTKDFGMMTEKYSAGDKITASAEDLRGASDISRELRLTDSSNPFRYNVRAGTLARAAGGGIHFFDEFFRNKVDLMQICLQVIQDRDIELQGHHWSIDTLILGTSNTDAYHKFVAERTEGPIKDRCQVCFVSHNTDYKLQSTLTGYVLNGADGAEERKTIMGEPLHQDPNLNYALSVAAALTRIPRTEKLSPIEAMKLEAGEIAGEKSVKTLTEVKQELNAQQDVSKRWGQKGIGHRGLGRIKNRTLALPATQKGKCLLALDCFKEIEKEINDYVSEAMDREKFMADVKIARKEFRRQVETAIYNAYRDDPEAIRKDVMAYVYMVIGVGSDKLGPDNIWRYYDPRTGEQKPLKIDKRYIDSVETRMGFSTEERKETFRTTVRKIYGHKMATEPTYDFMDQENLVKAVTEVRLKSEVAGAGSLVGALINQTDEECRRLRNKMLDTMQTKLGYCITCALSNIEYFCEKQDEA